MNKEDLKLLGDLCKKELLKIAIESDYIKQKLTFKQHIYLCKEVYDLSDRDAILTLLGEGIREFEGAFRKFLKYSFAIIAAGAAGAAAPFLGPLILYSWRKLSDPCYKRCFSRFGRPKQRKVCKYECQVKASEEIARRIRAEVTKCTTLEEKKQDKCRKKLRNQLLKWEKKVQEQRVKLQKARVDLEEKERLKKQKELSKRAKKIAKRAAPYESLSPAKRFMLRAISESNTIRNQLTFKEHLQLYNGIKNLPYDKFYKLVGRLAEQETPPVTAPKVDPKKEKWIRRALYLGLWVVPVPFFNDVINYIIKKHDFACMKRCVTKAEKSFCYSQCRHLGRQYAVKFLRQQLTKCSRAEADKVAKCKKKVLNLMQDWRQREVETRHKYEDAVHKRLMKVKRMKAKAGR